MTVSIIHEAWCKQTIQVHYRGGGRKSTTAHTDAGVKLSVVQVGNNLLDGRQSAVPLEFSN